MKKGTKKKDLIRKTKIELLEKDKFLLKLSKAIVEAEKIKQEYVEKGLCPYCSQKVEQKDKKEFCSDDHKTNYYGKGKPKKYRSSNEPPDFASILTNRCSVLREGIKKFELPDFEPEETEEDLSYIYSVLERGNQDLDDDAQRDFSTILIEEELWRKAGFFESVQKGTKIYELLRIKQIKSTVLAIDDLAKKELDRKKEEDQRLMRREIVSPLLDENERKEEKIERTQEEEEKIDWKARRELIFARNY